ncbi:macrophage mannose receptor 1-like isoform X2 [Photinus pyralis]|uniref:C-type lectin domain-containing protein n=1 Tax=Photinus pyralis TaxID=7054 RepID=A0A1Y1MI73_PHOPY|nr:macrophage mannose receptor 1-like isoform X2 [Photinus pyralis]XP_031334906.1 macrophage mannose receptor 1-like isoform X2 [Photinus pyralis]XP_031334907.1 macrophage mannose receptor 1-like isoform X2 [Photinus pyralis]XP_031334908.1 macrophage mannose receptor 1-like isoform X2 [Photinus pyralis]
MNKVQSIGTYFCLVLIYSLLTNCMEFDWEDTKELSFVYLNKEYLILEYRVNWDEALIICQTFENGSLAIIRDLEVRTFLARCLEETAPNADTYWIGAERRKNAEHFFWIDNGEQFVDNNCFILRGTDYIRPQGRECLCFSRRNHNDGLYFNLDCKLKRALICERPFENKYDGSMTTAEWIIVNDYKYGIFYDRKSWSQAVRACQKYYNGELATFRNTNETGILGKYLLIGRPSLENAWIGGRYTESGWRFISDDVIIPDHKDSVTHFPPWFLNQTRQRGGCLVLDRHLANEAVFVETRCSRRMSYICSKKIVQTPEKVYHTFNNVEYTIYYIKQSWDEAYETCLAHNTTLVKVTLEVIHALVHMMGEMDYEIYHVWIGGRLNEDGTNFEWVEDNEIIKKQSEGIDWYPPWYDTEFDLKYPCLNMDRENHNRPMFYGADCGHAQEFICERKHTKVHASFGVMDDDDFQEIEGRMF